MSVESNREMMLRYLNSKHSEISLMAEDVVFTIMATGQEHRGREGVAGMLAYFYHVAFEATASIEVFLCDEKKAVVETAFIGKHVGDFAGIYATGKDVRVPLCVVYDLVNNQIKRSRVYFEIPALMQQLGVQMG